MTTEQAKSTNISKPNNDVRVAGTVEEDLLVKKIEISKSRLKSYVLDLKVRTPLSLIGNSPLSGLQAAPALVRLAIVKGIDIIAVTDRNTGFSLDSIINAARGTQLTVIPGVELRTSLNNCDNLIVTCLFSENRAAENVSEFLTALGVPPEAAFNDDFIVPRPFDSIVNEVEERGGAIFPSRIDKTPNRLATLPFLVERYGFRAFDLSYGDSARFFSRKWPNLKFSLFSFSNANALAQVGSRSSKVKLSSAGFSGIQELVKRITT
jgi:hypothetical protein